MNSYPDESDDFLEFNGHKVYFKNSENMREIPDNSIQLVITSPPYGTIKDYGTKYQIGFNDGFETYIQRLTNVWRECFRILEPQCRLVINVGDQYLRKTEYKRYRIFSIHSAIIEECLKIGFDYLGDIIWQKISTTNTTGGCSLMGSVYYPRNGLLTYDYEHILIFKKWNGKERKVNLKTKELSKICLDEWKNWYNGHWIFPGIQQKEHIAMFPEELPYRIIRMFSYIGDTVLDPFLGSGTVLKVADQLKRKGIGYEINKNFKQIIIKKLTARDTDNRKDFHKLLMFLAQYEKLNKLKFNFELSKRKGYTVVSDLEYKKNIAIDILITDKISNSNELNDLIKKKINENNIQNFLKSITNPEINKIYKFLIILTYLPKEFGNILTKFNRKFANKLKFIEWDKFYNNYAYIQRILSENNSGSKISNEKIKNLNYFLKKKLIS